MVRIHSSLDNKKNFSKLKKTVIDYYDASTKAFRKRSNPLDKNRINPKSLKNIEGISDQMGMNGVNKNSIGIENDINGEVKEGGKSERD